MRDVLAVKTLLTARKSKGQKSHTATIPGLTPIGQTVIPSIPYPKALVSVINESRVLINLTLLNLKSLAVQG